MTTYLFECRNCGADASRVYPMGTAPDKIDCPETGCDDFAYRVISAPSVHFGQGFSRSSYGGKTK